MAALQAATILVAIASRKNFWLPKFWRKSGDGDHFTVKGRQKATFGKSELGALSGHIYLVLFYKLHVTSTFDKLKGHCHNKAHVQS